VRRLGYTVFEVVFAVVNAVFLCAAVLAVAWLGGARRAGAVRPVADTLLVQRVGAHIMASSKGQVTLRGRFSPGDVVTLTKVAGPHVLRPEGGEEIETQTVTEEKDAPRVGYVRFSKGVEIGARYFIHGLHDGRPQEVRITGKTRTIRRRCSSRRRSCRTGCG
jgi:hypothetical protein